MQSNCKKSYYNMSKKLKAEAKFKDAQRLYKIKI